MLPSKFFNPPSFPLSFFFSLLLTLPSESPIRHLFFLLFVCFSFVAAAAAAVSTVY